ncbi:MAG TPA: hypothetical protein VFP71_12640 [Candidatus Angelobacter sp.]|nr:hypothetical protein [Candidatus Angelobacter sp.]
MKQRSEALAKPYLKPGWEEQMFAWKKIIRKGSDHANSAPLPEKVTYSLETIMALQKSLERGFDDYIPRPKAPQDASRTKPKYQPALTARFTKAKGFLQQIFLLKISGISRKRKELTEKPGRTAQPSS